MWLRGDSRGTVGCGLLAARRVVLVSQLGLWHGVSRVTPSHFVLLGPCCASCFAPSFGLLFRFVGTGDSRFSYLGFRRGEGAVFWGQVVFSQYCRDNLFRVLGAAESAVYELVSGLLAPRSMSQCLCCSSTAVS